MINIFRYIYFLPILFLDYSFESHAYASILTAFESSLRQTSNSFAYIILNIYYYYIIYKYSYTTLLLLLLLLLNTPLLLLILIPTLFQFILERNGKAIELSISISISINVNLKCFQRSRVLFQYSICLAEFKNLSLINNLITLNILKSIACWFSINCKNDCVHKKIWKNTIKPIRKVVVFLFHIYVYVLFNGHSVF